MEDGLTIALSPVQLAAVLSQQNITEAETLSNRLLGGLDLALGSVELMGATALCLAPDPTMLTKAACIATGAHSMDAIHTAIDRILTGRDTRTATFQTAASLAKQFGASEDTAWRIGLTVDIAVPFAPAMAIGAARIAKVRMGRIRLIEHEGIKGMPGGGHTIAKHVGKTPEELFQRIEKSIRSGNLYPQPVGSFASLDVAETVITAALKNSRPTIKAWLESSLGSRQRSLTIMYSANRNVGIVVKPGSTIVYKANRIKIVLIRQFNGGKPYFILTAYPEV